jgi:hypothetical protein
MCGSRGIRPTTTSRQVNLATKRNHSLKANSTTANSECVMDASVITCGKPKFKYFMLRVPPMQATYRGNIRSLHLNSDGTSTLCLCLQYLTRGFLPDRNQDRYWYFQRERQSVRRKGADCSPLLSMRDDNWMKGFVAELIFSDITDIVKI